MSHFFLQQADYLDFLYGFLFFLLGMIGYSRWRGKDPKLPWKWLALYGLIGGLREWKTETVPVYEVFDADPPALIVQKILIREGFERGVYEYHAGSFTQAAAIFADLSGLGVEDRPVEIYRERCARSLKLGSAEPARAEGGV